MFGYLQPEVSELKVRELSRYRAYYCGLCRALGAACGPMCRTLLRYDLVTLSLVRDALIEQPPEVNEGRCPYNPLRKVYFVHSPAQNYAARLHLLVWLGKVKDDLSDGGRLGARLLKRALVSPLKRADVDAWRGDLDDMLIRQAQLEQESCAQPDEAAEPFARFSAKLFSRGWPQADAARALDFFGYNVGKWIYWIDALDDFSKDEKTGGYNPWRAAGLDREGAAKRALSALGQCAAGARMALDVMDIKRDEGVLRNITDHGMPAMARRIAEGGKRRAGSLRGIGRSPLGR